MFEFYAVGGAVRDELLGIRTKDIDYTVVATNATDVDDAFGDLGAWLRTQGYQVFLVTPEFLTIRARFPKGHQYAGVTADFVLARREGPYSDRRRPDWVVPGTLEDDLRRRDFTVNALARSQDGTLIDLFGGVRDLNNRVLRCVGSARERFEEDALRALRAVRFIITKGFFPDPELSAALHSTKNDTPAGAWLTPLLRGIAIERVREELRRCFAHDTYTTLRWLATLGPEFQYACFRDGLWLDPSLSTP